MSTKKEKIRVDPYEWMDDLLGPPPIVEVQWRINGNGDTVAVPKPTKFIVDEW